MGRGFCFEMIPPGSRVLCALSGGPDSMYLLCRLLEGADRGGYTVQAAHYNHTLRPEAQREEEFVVERCARFGVPLTLGRGDVAARAAQLGLGIEECARHMRYEFLERTARENDCQLIATGHQAGDNAETVLMNLIRGSGLKGLTGIPPRRGKVIRPMLEVSREEIEAWLQARDIPFVEDGSNADLTYTRNRIRHQVLPLLEQINPRATQHICAAAGRLAEDEGELARQAQALLEQAAEESPEGITLSVFALCQAPRPVALRALGRLGPGWGAEHLERLLALCAAQGPSAQLDLPGCTVRRIYDRLLLAEGQSAPPDPIPLGMGEQRWGEWTVEVRPARCPEKAFVSPGDFYLKDRPYTVRARQEGDTLRPGERPEKSIKKWMIEQKIPRHCRALIPVIAGEEGVAAAGELGPHREALAQPGEACLHIILRKGE